MKLLAALLLPATLLLAGCTSMGHDMSSMGGSLDTGDIKPGETRNLTFATTGTVRIHCHQHPFMTQNITVTDAAPETHHIHIQDGANMEDYRFVEANLTLGKGSTLTYHNHGTQVHSATNAMDGM